MHKNSSEFSMNEAKRLAQSEKGQQLISLLQSKDSPALSSAMDRATAGDLNAAKEAISALMADPQVMALLNQLGGSSNG